MDVPQTTTFLGQVLFMLRCLLVGYASLYDLVLHEQSHPEGWLSSGLTRHSLLTLWSPYSDHLTGRFGF
jgi:hypothetical protein